MSDGFVEAQRRRLEEAKHGVEERIAALQSEESPAEQESDLGPAEDLQADVTERRDDRQNNLSELTERLRMYKRSLDRIEQGVYGECERCGKPIARERLEAAPTASFCIECQRELERKQGPR